MCFASTMTLRIASSPARVIDSSSGLSDSRISEIARTVPEAPIAVSQPLSR